MSSEGISLREEVRSRYAASATSVAERGQRCCDCGDTECCDPSHNFDGALYGDAGLEVPEAAMLASLGCGNPVVVAELKEGERVLDLGSGGGIDVILSAKRVGPSGKAYGLDMTDEMLSLAIRNASEAEVDNVEFLKGYIEDIPLPSETIDVVISNCVINLSVDKPKVLTEMARVLRRGGRLGISDIVAEDHLTPAERAERGSFAGCIAGALSFSEYGAGLLEAGFEDISVTPTHAVADGLYAAIIKATKGESGSTEP